ncbi:hypothetical protein [Aquabacterium sp. CECT 9606]|uniref:hypothetical protein n=1 Tax=Aquabacterium sp. CECT 9606 TaxID=2845822 RepID=UPI001E5AD014|nr:hypothetical protein [Aquabacterium sp. CECT 9606]CAH0355994.1 hypothetical protein AQB9606_04492 [Aquabacterium sp. CECT 9606]
MNASTTNTVAPTTDSGFPPEPSEAHQRAGNLGAKIQSSFMVIEAVRDITGLRYSTKAGERREIRFGYGDASFVPRLVEQARAGQAIDWGGAAVQPGYYRVLFDGPGPLPAQFRSSYSVQEVANRLTPDAAGDLNHGDVVRDLAGREYLAMGARHDWLEVAPIENGKAQVSRDTCFKFLLSPDKQDAYPEWRADPVFFAGRNLYQEACKVRGCTI